MGHPEGVEDDRCIGEGHGVAHERGGARGTHRDPPTFGRTPRLRGPAQHTGARPPGDQRRTSASGTLHALRIGTPLEAVGGLGMQVRTARGPDDPGPREKGALEQDVGRGVGDLGCLPTHDPGDRHRSFEVADQQVLRGELPFHAVEGHESFTGLRTANDDPGPASRCMSKACSGWPSSNIA